VTDRDDLARRAVTEALRLRCRRGHGADQPVCPIDLALDEGVDLRLESIKSLEGMYTPDGPLIILGSLRPQGRRSYTCAHELGHHVFGHGLRIDELLEGEPEPARKDEAEYIADRFAAALLMPKLAVLHAFAARAWEIRTSTPEQIYTIAGLLGVGYTTLLGYLEGTLRSLSSSAARQLRKTSPKAIRTRVLGTDTASGLIIVDEFWSGRPVDAEVGDAIVVPSGMSLNGDAVEHVRDGLLRAKAPGSARLRGRGLNVEVRITRRAFTGLAVYRHLEEADDDA
jgi:hypothetical protein